MFVGHGFFKHSVSVDFSCGLIVCWRLAVSPWFAGANSAVIRCHHEGTFAPRMRNGLKETRALGWSALSSLSFQRLSFVYFTVSGLQFDMQNWFKYLLPMKPSFICLSISKITLTQTSFICHQRRPKQDFQVAPPRHANECKEDC